MSMPIPGDVLPLWNPEIPGEEIQAGRLGIRVRPGTPAAAKVTALEAHVVKEWDGDLEGFTAIVLREQAKSDPLLDSTMRFIEHLRDYRENLAEAAVRRYEATEQWIECPKCETEVPTSNGIHCPNCG